MVMVNCEWEWKKKIHKRFYGFDGSKVELLFMRPLKTNVYTKVEERERRNEKRSERCECKCFILKNGQK